MSTNLVFSGSPFVSQPTNLLFGETGGGGEEDISGISSIVVSFESSTTGELNPVGDSSINVEIQLTSTGVLTIYGNSDISVPVLTTADGFSTPENFGNSSIVVDVISVATGVREINSSSSIDVEILALGTGVREINGTGSIAVSVVTSSDGNIFGGPEIFGESTPTVYFSTSSAAAILYPIYSSSSIVVPISVLSSGTNIMVYEDILAQSSLLVDINTGAESDLIEKDKSYLIDKLVSNKDEITYEADIVVDIENEDYEIWKIRSSKSFLESVKRGKMKKTFKIGTEIKDEIVLTETPNQFYKTVRKTTLRKYGASEINLKINISTGYRFIRNEVNVKRLIEREVDRAIFDTYALYELEFE